ncbi:MAG: hypothetical protein HYU66_15140 [Armatimonadetes bacterium]|nr:hypothetical protein [Armatimonadota bacterium]
MRRRGPPLTVWMGTTIAGLYAGTTGLIGYAYWCSSRSLGAGDWMAVEGTRWLCFAGLLAVLSLSTLLGSNLARRLLVLAAVGLLPFGLISIFILLPLLGDSAVAYTSATRRWQRAEYVIEF